MNSLPNKQNRTGRIRRFHWLLQATGNMSRKSDMLSGYGVESTKDLKHEELEELIRYLESTIDSRDTPKSIRKKRSLVLDLLNKLGIYSDNRDWSKVNAFLSLPRIAGKLLYEMNEEELTALQRKLHAILKKKIEQQQQTEFLSRNN